MGNDGFPSSLAAVLAAAILGALLAVGLVVALLVSAAVSDSPGPLVAHVSGDVVDGTTDVIFSADGSSGGSQPYATYAWDFDGDGTVDLEGDGAEARDVTHEYASAGVYVVKLTVTDAEDNTDTRYLAVTVA